MLAGLALGLVCMAAPLKAGFADPAGPGFDPNTLYIPASAKRVKVAEHLGASLPMDATFLDDTGKPVHLGDYFTKGRKPVLLQIGYFRCPMLCGLISRGLVDSLKTVKLNAGPDYDVVFLSIDPKETPTLAAAKKKSFLESYGREGSIDGWHLLTGTKEQIDRVTEAAGVEYKWVGQAQQYSHPAVVVLCTPDGHIARYLYGVKFNPTTLRLSLVEASGGKIGTHTDQFLLTCFQFDGHQGKYALAAINLMKMGGVMTLLIMGWIFFHLYRNGAFSGSDEREEGARAASLAKLRPEYRSNIAEYRDSTGETPVIL
ncbi:MAG TPA: SCO family protein [Tepidisphaeraceae bacterium]|nr:SCO family protein [Tepidisphaeraceae bacterium]